MGKFTAQLWLRLLGKVGTTGICLPRQLATRPLHALLVLALVVALPLRQELLRQLAPRVGQLPGQLLLAQLLRKGTADTVRLVRVDWRASAPMGWPAQRLDCVRPQGSWRRVRLPMQKGCPVWPDAKQQRTPP